MNKTKIDTIKTLYGEIINLIADVLYFKNANDQNTIEQFNCTNSTDISNLYKGMTSTFKINYIPDLAIKIHEFLKLTNSKVFCYNKINKNEKFHKNQHLLNIIKETNRIINYINIEKYDISNIDNDYTYSIDANLTEEIINHKKLVYGGYVKDLTNYLMSKRNELYVKKTIGKSMINNDDRYNEYAVINAHEKSTTVYSDHLYIMPFLNPDYNEVNIVPCNIPIFNDMDANLYIKMVEYCKKMYSYAGNTYIKMMIPDYISHNNDCCMQSVHTLTMDLMYKLTSIRIDFKYLTNFLVSYEFLKFGVENINNQSTNNSKNDNDNTDFDKLDKNSEVYKLISIYNGDRFKLITEKNITDLCEEIFSIVIHSNNLEIESMNKNKRIIKINTIIALFSSSIFYKVYEKISDIYNRTECTKNELIDCINTNLYNIVEKYNNRYINSIAMSIGKNNNYVLHIYLNIIKDDDRK